LTNLEKKCLWRGSDINVKGYNLAAWEMVVVPKDKGGLGIKDLYVHNDTLLLKHLQKFYNKVEVSWVQLIWATYYQNKVTHLALVKGSFLVERYSKIQCEIQRDSSLLTRYGGYC
jgi:hypothetical protein